MDAGPPPRLTVARLLDRVFEIYFRHPLEMLAIGLIVMFLRAALPGQMAPDATFGVGWRLTELLAVVLLMNIAIMATCVVVEGAERGTRASIGEILGRTFRALPGLVLVFVIYIAGVLLSLLVLIVPGIVFMVSAGLSANALAFRGAQGIGAIQMSRALVRGRWWRTAWMWLLLSVPALLVGVLFEYLPKSPLTHWGAAFVDGLFYPLQLIGLAVMFLGFEAERAAARSAGAAGAPPPAASIAPALPAGAAAPPAAPALVAPAHAGFDAGAFGAFEHRGWQQAADAYHAAFGRLTSQAAGALLDAARVTRETRLLDIACGPGYVSGMAAARGAQVVGCDFSPHMLDLARRFVPTVEFRVADAEALPFPDASFDAATMAFLLGHLPHPERALAEARRVLRPGGRLALAWWEEFDRTEAFQIIYDAIRRHGRIEAGLPEGPPFEQFASFERIGRSLAEAGFEELEIHEHPMVWRMASGEEAFDASLNGTVRTAGLLRAQDPESLAAIRAEVVQRVEEHRDGDGVALQMPAWIASGAVPAGR